MAKDDEAWKEMEEYNIQDVVLLEQVYDKLKPWIKQHANQNLYGESTCVCPHCGGSHHQRRGLARTKSAVYQRWICKDCGTWFRATKAITKAPAVGYVTL
jgi:predicted RNA-binding Zn-ribbon protein involved in translation (DUF1610 family)